MFINNKNVGAHFSKCRKYRFALWRVWDHSKPLVMLIGLNPSTANEVDADPTIESVARIMKFNGYGGFYMMNCFPYVSTKPEDMVLCQPASRQWRTNNVWLWYVSKKCETVCFAWGAFKVAVTSSKVFSPKF